MQSIPFTKMHGTQNDYVYINGFQTRVEDPAALAVAMSRPHTGVGADGLILILPSAVADVRMRMFNSDGSEAEMCGNGARCVAKYAYTHGLTHQRAFTLETGAGVREVALDVDDTGAVSAVTVDMGVPALAPESLPVLLPGLRVVRHPLALQGHTVEITCVSVGNPHCVIFVEEDPFAFAAFEALGPALERHALFPRRVNVEFVQALSRSHARMRVWERGTGETRACGTGANATLVAGVLCGLLDRQAVISLAGGDLSIAWREADDHLLMTGPAATVFEGVWIGEA